MKGTIPGHELGLDCKSSYSHSVHVGNWWQNSLALYLWIFDMNRDLHELPQIPAILHCILCLLSIMR